MKNLRSIYAIAFCLAFIFASTNAEAQKLKVVEGDLSFMKSVDKISVEFDYSNLEIHKEKSEAAYIEKKVNGHNEKEPGKGDKWKDGWFGAREDMYQPSFIGLFNEIIGDKVSATQDTGQEYRMVVRSVWLNPGYNVGVSKVPASANFIIDFYQGDKSLASVSIERVPGSQVMGYDFDAGARIKECYALGGKTMAKHLKKKVLK